MENSIETAKLHVLMSDVCLYNHINYVRQQIISIA